MVHSNAEAHHLMRRYAGISEVEIDGGEKSTKDHRCNATDHGLLAQQSDCDVDSG